MKDPLPTTDKAGIYRLHCGTYTASYVGQTGRSFVKRFNKNLPALTNSQPHKSAMARHRIESGHRYDQIQSSILHICDTGPRLDRLEEIETIRLAQEASYDILNDLHVTYNNPFSRHFFNF